MSDSLDKAVKGVRDLLQQIQVNLSRDLVQRLDGAVDALECALANGPAGESARCLHDLADEGRAVVLHLINQPSTPPDLCALLHASQHELDKLIPIHP